MNTIAHDLSVAALSRSNESTSGYPKPPALHWALLLLLHVATAGILGMVWMFRQAAWVRRIDPTSNALFMLAVAIPGSVIAVALPLAAGTDDASLGLASGLGQLVCGVAVVWSFFSMRASIEGRFGVKLSGLLTFFFNVFYLQHHMRRIANGEYASGN